MKHVSEATVHIYALLDPNTLRVRYVGQSVDPLARFEQHLRATESPSVGEWILALRAAGSRPVLALLCQVGADEAPLRERQQIRLWRARGHQLLNRNDLGFDEAAVRAAIAGALDSGIGNPVSVLRAAVNATNQSALAGALGISQCSVSKIINGKQGVGVELALRLRELGIPIELWATGRIQAA